MTRTSQKESEKFKAELLSIRKNYTWRISIPPNEVEWPDLIIEDENGKFGLEVRDYYIDEGERGSIKKTRESQNQKIIDAIEKEYSKNNPYSLKVDFVGEINDYLFDDIQEFLKSLSLNVWENKVIRIPNAESNLSIYITRIPDNLNSNFTWRCINDHAGFVDQNPVKNINKIIKEKARKIQKYKKNLTIISLLIYIDSKYSSGMLRLNSNDKIEKDEFEKVYILLEPFKILVF